MCNKIEMKLINDSACKNEGDVVVLIEIEYKNTRIPNIDVNYDFSEYFDKISEDPNIPENFKIKRENECHDIAVTILQKCDEINERYSDVFATDNICKMIADDIRSTLEELGLRYHLKLA